MTSNKLIRSLFYMMSSSGLVLGLSIGITVALAKLLSPRDLGILMAAEAFIELFNFFFNTGFRNSMLKVSAADEKGFEEGLNKAVANAILIRAIVLIPVCVLIYFIAAWTQGDYELVEIIRYYVFIYALESFSSIFGIARKAMGQFKLMSVIITTNKILRFSVIFIVLTYFGGLKLLVQVFLIEKVIRLLISAISTLRLLKPKLEKKLIPEMLKHSFGYGVLDSLEGIQGRIDRVMLNGILGATTVAFYSIPSKLNRATKLLPKAISQVFLPNLHETVVNDPERFKSTTKKLSRFLALAGIFVFLFVFYFGEPVLFKIFGSKYAESLGIVKFFAFINLIWFLEKVPELVLMSKAEHKKRAVVLGVSILTNIALNLVFIPLYGLVGAVYATMIANGLRMILYIAFSSKYLALFKTIAIIVLPVLLVFYLPWHYMLVLVVAYLFIARLITEDDFLTIKNAFVNK